MLPNNQCTFSFLEQKDRVKCLGVIEMIKSIGSIIFLLFVQEYQETPKFSLNCDIIFLHNNLSKSITT